jgi:hypothetical protein
MTREDVEELKRRAKKNIAENPYIKMLMDSSEVLALIEFGERNALGEQDSEQVRSEENAGGRAQLPIETGGSGVSNPKS